MDHLNEMNKKNSFNINSYVSAIDNEYMAKIERLVSKNENNNIDIPFEMYNKSLLTPERLKFIMKRCTKYFNISTALLKQLMKDDKDDLLDVIFKYLRFYDNEFILNLLSHYQDKTELSTPELKQQISKEKYKIPTNKEGYLKAGKYLYNECEKGGKDPFNEHKKYKNSINIIIVKFLVEQLGADINIKGFSNYTPLFFACQNENEAIVKYLVKHGADVNEGEWGDKIPLFEACKSGNEAIVKCLIELGADINKEDKNGITPLFKACNSGNESLVKYFVEHGLDINKEDKDGETPLFYACASGNVSLVKYLVEQLGADLNKKDKDGKTLLFKACNNGNESLVKYFVEHGLDINKEDKDGKTPLFYACASGNVSLVKYLVEQLGADLNKKDNNGKRPFLSVGRDTRNFSLISYLSQRGGVNMSNENEMDLYLFWATYR